MADTPSFAGRVALVTGAGSGIGRAAATRLAREGAAVVLVGRREAELAVTAQLVEEAGGQADVSPADVTDDAAARALVAGVVARHGRLDLAFNNAGIVDPKPIAEADVDDFDRIVAVNLRAVWLLVKSEAAAMRAGGRGGAIVNTSSFLARVGNPGQAAYAASKGALDAMIRPLAVEFGAHGIRINNVAPGVIRTPMSMAGGEEGLRPFAERAALGRLGEPEDVAEVAAWLLSEGARFVTGETVLADGGLTAAFR